MKRSHKSPTEANVSTMKVHLGRFLKQVKQGEEVIILDRNHPVAKLIPFSGDEEKPAETAPSSSWQEVSKILKANGSKRKVPRLKRTSLFYLNQDREGR